MYRVAAAAWLFCMTSACSKKHDPPTNRAAIQPADQVADPPANRAAIQPADQVTDPPANRAAIQPADPPATRPAGQPATLPANQPAIPANQSANPANQPAIPANQPSIPANQPAIPANQPAIPANQPAIPANQPAIPANQPAIPANQPAIPANRPAIPANQPAPRACFDTHGRTSAAAKALFDRRHLQGGGPTWRSILELSVRQRVQILGPRASDVPAGSDGEFRDAYEVRYGRTATWFSADDEADGVRFCAGDPRLLGEMSGEFDRLNADPIALERAVDQANGIE
jgi:hypothetical protein